MRSPNLVMAIVIVSATAGPAYGRQPPTKPSVVAATQPVAAAPAPRPSRAQTLKDVTYATIGDKALLLDMYLPAAAKPMPVVVWIHGGGWQGGSKDRCSAQWLTASGYAVVSVEYRFLKEAFFPACVQDCRAAIRFLRANAQKYNLDPDRIGAFGISAGGRHGVNIVQQRRTVEAFFDKCLKNNQAGAETQPAKPDDNKK